jgi:hypothetical protein
MGNLVTLLQKCKRHFGNTDDSEQLNLFLNTLTKFNEMEPINPRLKKEIQMYFYHRWAFNLNNAVSTPEDQAMFDECPFEVKCQIMMFLYEGFLQKYRYFFCLRNFEMETTRNDIKIQHTYYNRFNQFYRTFMLNILEALEPCKLRKGQILLDENEVCEDITFLANHL